MRIVRWIARYVPTTHLLEVGHPQDIYRSYTGYIQTYTGYTGIQDTQDLYRLISDVDVSSTRTVLREKYVRMPSVSRDAGGDGDNRTKTF